MLTINKTLNHLIKHKKLYLTLLLLVILISPYFIRYLNHNTIIIGAPSYFHLNQAEQLTKENFYQDPYHLLLSLNFTQTPYLYQIIPLILGFLSLFLLFHLTKKLKIAPQNQFFFLFFLILSPAFIYTFTLLNHYSFFIFLNLLGFALLFQEKKLLNYLSFPVFAFIPFLDIFSSILTLLLLAIYFYFKKNNLTKPLAFTIVILTFINLLLNKPFLLGPYFPQNTPFDLFSDLGGLFGFSLFALLLALIGLVITWKKRKIYLTYPFLILLLALFFYQTSTLIYLNFLIIFFASSGFLYLYNKEWKLNIIKNTSLFLLILGLIFPALTALNNFSTLPPSPEIKQSLLWFRENTVSYKIIFSHPQEGYLIEYFSRRPAFIHYDDADFKTRRNITNQIFQSSYIKTTFPLLEQNSISHLYLSPKTKANLPTNTGLLFLFQNERFKRIYNKNSIEIWEFE